MLNELADVKHFFELAVPKVGVSGGMSFPIPLPYVGIWPVTTIRQRRNFRAFRTHLDASKPWLDEYKGYFTAAESLPAGMTTIEWWGDDAGGKEGDAPGWDCFLDDNDENYEVDVDMDD
ncbi:hypothetical protein DFH09DRAFT_1108051 [Mycena vulgaris]|nr:hypothetical protein DFH09DRAFT_1108051 [Mycena vulgaris]